MKKLSESQKKEYYSRVGKWYIRLSDFIISQSEFNQQVKQLSTESGITESELVEQGYFYSFKK